jgi:hypothetical protein
LNGIQNEELFEEEEEHLLTFAEDPLNGLLDSGPGHCESGSSFETLSVREDSEGGQQVVPRGRHRRTRERPPSPLESDAFASLSGPESEKPAMRDSEWEEMSDACFCEEAVSDRQPRPLAQMRRPVSHLFAAGRGGLTVPATRARPRRS